jgi:hypothetical protein
MVRAETEIINKLGLHARASAKLTQTCRQLRFEVWMEKRGAPDQRQEHHGRDDAGRRQGFDDGRRDRWRDEQQALEAILGTDRGQVRRGRVSASMSFTLHGLAVSGGIAIGQAHLMSQATLEVSHLVISPRLVDKEVARFEAALARVREEFAAIKGDGTQHTRPSSALSSTCIR